MPSGSSVSTEQSSSESSPDVPRVGPRNEQEGLCLPLRVKKSCLDPRTLSAHLAMSPTEACP